MRINSERDDRMLAAYVATWDAFGLGGCERAAAEDAGLTETLDAIRVEVWFGDEGPDDWKIVRTADWTERRVAAVERVRAHIV
jgi:hypothetical protein